jgi:hypothetical protein
VEEEEVENGVNDNAGGAAGDGEEVDGTFRE